MCRQASLVQGKDVRSQGAPCKERNGMAGGAVSFMNDWQMEHGMLVSSRFRECLSQSQTHSNTVRIAVKSKVFESHVFFKEMIINVCAY